MPWTTEDVEHKTKAADTPKKKEVWVKVANSALKRCEEKKQGNCEARAIKQANAVVGRMGEAEDFDFECWFDELDEEMQGMIGLHVHGLKSALDSERALRKEAERQMKQPEPQDFSGDVIPLLEKSVRSDGLMPVKIIQPGWGTSGYYSPDVLQRDGPKVFKAGTKMFWDHPMPEEEAARPEGSLRDLAAELAGDAYWDSNNVLGPGLYADAKVFSAFTNAVDELAPHIGLSIRGLGKAKEGEADGRKGPIIEEISAARSVDFVTMPGAGGKILQLFEAARGRAAIEDDDGGTDMEELEKLKEAYDELEGKHSEAEAENARLKEILLLGKAKTMVSGKLAEFELPDVTRSRLVESLSKNPPVADGELDEEGLEEMVIATVEAEMAYIAEVAGSGSIRGMGADGSPVGAEEGKKVLFESFKAKYENEGKSPEEAEAMAQIAAAGR